jgi:LemA protein
MTQIQIVLLALGAVGVCWMVGAYNRLVGLRTEIGQAWAQVDEALQRRQALMQGLLDSVQEPLAEDAGTLAAAEAALRQVRAAADAVKARPVATGSVASLCTAETLVHSTQARVFALLEHEPELRDSAAVVTANAGLQDLEQRLAFARQRFNDAAAAYNDAARQFPTRLLSRLYGFGTAGRL